MTSHVEIQNVKIIDKTSSALCDRRVENMESGHGTGSGTKI